jgi:hypothetical protein
VVSLGRLADDGVMFLTNDTTSIGLVIRANA